MEENQYTYQIPDQNVSENRPKKKSRTGLKVLGIVCLVIVFVGLAGIALHATNIMVQRLLGAQNSQPEVVEETEDPVMDIQLNQASSTVVSDVSEVVESVMPSVVSITNMSVQQVQSFFGGITEEEVKSSGSGIIIGENDSELLVVTNNHVVEGSNTLTVTFVDETSVEGVIKGTEANKDLAIVAIPIQEIEETTRDAIRIAQIGDSHKLKAGEPAIAIGNALGYGQSVTVGVISATARNLEIAGFDNVLIQTDAAINPGNSGGALLNASGEVIGINTIKVSSSIVEGMGYAIPISDVSDIITTLMNKTTRVKVSEDERGYLGIQGIDVTVESSQMYNIPQGVYVSEVIEGSGAESAGLVKGDIIIGLQDESIQNMSELQEELTYYASGTTVKVQVLRAAGSGEYQESIFEITLTKNRG